MSDGSVEPGLDTRRLQQERMDAMSKLAAGVAHEINNPTGVLLMKLKFLLSVAAEEGLSERAVSTIGIAVEQTERIEGIVENLLDFSRPSAATPRCIDVNRSAAAAMTEFSARRQEQGSGSGPQVLWQPAAGALMVEADPGELQQVFVHLLDNAVHAAGPEGHVVFRTGSSGADVTMEVGDDGPGIPPDFRSRIFDPFFTTRPVGEGTGLGLAITYGIVQRYGGSIDVHSVRHEGTMMTVRLPAAPAGPAA